MVDQMKERNHGTDHGIIWKAGRFQWSLDSRALVMGILNVTPDSFSDGGRFDSSAAILEAAHQMVEEGAEIIDVGGESTRPGAPPVSAKDELKRVIPVIESIRQNIDVAISIDTYKAEVAAAALDQGVDIINDVSGFRDPAMIELCSESDCGLVVMHMKGTPQTMQKMASYDHVLGELKAFFEERFERLTQSGIEAQRLVFDPGIGFGKTLEHNLSLIHDISRYQVGNRPILMGLSRKSFIASLIGDPELSRREAPTQALTTFTRIKGAMVHRVHQVRENHDALRMVEAILTAL